MSSCRSSIRVAVISISPVVVAATEITGTKSSDPKSSTMGSSVSSGIAALSICWRTSCILVVNSASDMSSNFSMKKA